MLDLGPHAHFIWLSYAAVALGILGLLLWAAGDERAQKRRLAELERRGIRRRSAGQTEKAAAE